jgi:pimeloyl-ACP methyl ester carboxylesterase
MGMVKVGDLNFECYVEGSGPPLLMIMGWIGNAGFWGEAFLEPLRSHFQVIRLSNRGTGLSDRPADELTVPLMAEDAAGVLRELGIPRAHVLGISMGGMIAQELALNHPEAVRALVLGCTTCGFSHGVPTHPDVVANASQVSGAQQDAIRQFLLSAATPEFVQGAGQEFWAWIISTWMAAPTPWESIGRQFMAIQKFDTYERLPGIMAPTFIVHGDRDQLVPVGNADILHERIAGSQVRIIPGVGHMFFWEKPEESAGAIVEFLKTAVPA